MSAQLPDLADQIIDAHLSDPDQDHGELASTVSVSDETQLSQAYIALINALRKKPTPLKPIVTRAGAPLLGIDTPEQTLPHPAKGLELAILWQLIGHLTNDSKLLQAGAAAEQFIRSLKDRFSRPFTGIWTRESDIKTYVPSPSIQNLLDSLGIRKQSELTRCVDKELGIAVHHGDDYSLALCATGWGSGVCSLMRQDVGIIAMGPQAAPFENADAFGVHFTPATLHDVKEHKPLPGVHIDERGHLFTYSAWTRTKEHQWCNIYAQAEKTVDLKMQFLDLKGSEMCIAMAVKADACRVGETLEVLAGSLKAYRGPVAPVALEGKNSQLVMLPEGGASMRIVPLAGDESCWQADFLILYLLEADTPKVSWNIY